MRLREKRKIFLLTLAIFIVFVGTVCKRKSQESEEKPLSKSAKILKEAADHYLNLMKKYPLFIESIQTKLEEQYKKGIVVPKEELGMVILFLSSFIREGGQSQFYIEDDRLEGIEDSVKREFQRDLVQARVGYADPQ